MHDAPSSTMLASRALLLPRLREHAEQLSQNLGAIALVHREAGEVFAHWIAKNHQPGTPLHAIVVCTGNSRRSILGASMGNLIAAFSGMPEIRFHSGGTDPTAFNPRTVSALKSIGFEIEPTGDQAERGEPETENPVYRICWGDGFETLEFSKHYANPSNPRSGFAALMVCNEADAGCPTVNGAAIRISLPFQDPKSFDGQSCEADKYAERRDEIGRVMLWVMRRVRELQDQGSLS